mmetsp:Transcript_1359/g.2113  ORF Transcript_1359/g.2113 Transcript_1359/m.2113 type:complete len:332 (-) Transcript_1359:1309-2304(-)
MEFLMFVNFPVQCRRSRFRGYTSCSGRTDGGGSIKKKRKADHGWEKEAEKLREANVEHSFFPYLSLEGSGDPGESTLDVPSRTLFSTSRAGSSTIARVESGKLVTSEGNPVRDADAIWSTERGVGIAALRSRLDVEPRNIGVPVLIGTKGGQMIAACNVTLMSVAAGMIEQLISLILEAIDLPKRSLIAAVGTDERFDLPVAVETEYVNKFFFPWEETLARGARRRIFFVHDFSKGYTETSVIARSRKRSSGPAVKLAVRSKFGDGDVWFLNIPQIVAERIRQRGIDDIDMLSTSNMYHPERDSASDQRALKAEGDEVDNQTEQLAALIVM